MREINDQWVWFVGDELIPALLSVDPDDPQLKKRAASSPHFVRAVNVYLEGRAEEAVVELAKSPIPSYECYSAMGHIQFELHRWDEAAASYGKAANVQPGSVAAWFNQGLCHEKLRRYHDAAAAFEKAAQLQPDRDDAWFGLAVSLMHMKKPKQALEILERLLRRSPKNFTVAFGKAVTLQMLWQYDQALALYRRLIEYRPEAQEVLANIIAIGMVRKDIDLIEPYATTLRQLSPKSRAALEGLAFCAFTKGDFATAAKLCSALTEACPELVEGWFNLGIACQRLGRLDSAALALQRAADLHPHHETVHACLAAVHHEKGDWPAARAAYESAIEHAPHRVEPLWGLALGLEGANRPKEAEAVYSKLVQVAPDSAEAWFRLGWLRAELAEWGGSVEAFAKCTSLRKAWPDAYLNLGVALWHIGDLEESERAFEAALKLSPGSPDVLRAIASLAIEKRELPRAVELEAKLSAMGEQTAELLYHIGLLRQSCGEFQDASTFYRRALTQKPQFSEALVNLGHALRALGDEDNARQCWTQAVEAEPRLADNYFSRKPQ